MTPASLPPWPQGCSHRAVVHSIRPAFCKSITPAFQLFTCLCIAMCACRGQQITSDQSHKSYRPVTTLSLRFINFLGCYLPDGKFCYCSAISIKKPAPCLSVKIEQVPNQASITTQAICMHRHSTWLMQLCTPSTLVWCTSKYMAGSAHDLMIHMLRCFRSQMSKC